MVAHNRTGAAQESLATMREMAALMRKQTDQGPCGPIKKTENVGSRAHVILWLISGSRPAAMKQTGDSVDSTRLSGIFIYAAQTNFNSDWKIRI